MKRLAWLGAFLLLAGCTRADQARDALQSAGYTDIRTGGYSWFSCSKDDTFSTTFEARGPSGVPVRGAVCSGLLKGSTIRIF
jgi:hypothetical protein